MGQNDGGDVHEGKQTAGTSRAVQPWQPVGKLGTLPLPVMLSVAELFFRGKGREWMGVDESMGDEKG